MFVSSGKVILDEDACLPEGTDGWIGLHKNMLVVRLASRKNAFFGQIIKRSCTCVSRSGASAHAPAAMCPVHILGKWLSDNVAVGTKVFSNGVAARAARWLKIALVAREVRNFQSFGLHSLRRGAARALVDSGSDLATILKAGGWKSSAFAAYLDLMGVEMNAFQRGVDALADLDSEDGGSTT